MSEQSSTKMVPSAFENIAGVKEEKPRNANSILGSKSALLFKYTPAEFQNIAKRGYVSPNPNMSQGNITAEGLISYFLPIHEEIGNILFDHEKMKKLAPEINRAKLIRTSTIMSPNDLQEGEFTFSLDSIQGLSDDAKQKICELLSDYFNNVMKFSRKSADWIGDCLYGVGSKAFFILPSSYYLSMREDGLQLVGNNNFNDKKINDIISNVNISIKDKIEKICDTPIYNKVVGTESWTRNVIKNEKDTNKINASFIADVCKGFTIDKKDTTDFKVAIENMVVRFVKEIEEGDIIKLTENPEIIKFSTEYKQKTKKKLSEQIDSYLHRYMVYQNDQMVSMNQYESNDKEEIGHPIFMELPSESVIPICVPGTKDEHLGYFILLDEYGQPLKADPRIMSQSISKDANLQASYTAMFGGNEVNSVFQNVNYRQYERTAVERVFHKLTDQFLKSKLQGIGLEEVDISKSNAISIIMLHRLFESKKTRILYVPPDLLKYFCFDYRSNGTGKSLLEDIHYILSLRITFQVAAIMGMARDSINHRDIGINFDKKETNALGLMNQVLNMYVDKERLNFTLDPMEISRNIARNAISIIPSNLPGLGEFKLEKSESASSGGNNKVPNELLDALDNLLVTALGVPYSALNKLGNDEFAKSVITNDLFFSKQTHQDQNKYCPFIKDMATTYIKYSPILRKKIIEIIHEFTKKVDSDKINAKNPDRGTKTISEPSKEMNADVIKQTNHILSLILENITVSLPTPNIAHDKAQYEEVQQFITSIDQVVDKLYPQELVPNDSTDATNALTIMKAYVKRAVLTEFMGKLGVVHNFKIPTLDKFDQSIPTEELQTLLNFMSGVKNKIKHLSNADAGSGMDFGSSNEFESNNSDMETGQSDIFPTDINEPTVSDEIPAANEEEDNQTTFTPTDTEQP